MPSKISKSPSKLTLHSEEVGARQESKDISCPRCKDTGFVETWYDASETRRITSECPQCRVEVDLPALRKAGL